MPHTAHRVATYEVIPNCSLMRFQDTVVMKAAPCLGTRELTRIWNRAMSVYIPVIYCWKAQNMCPTIH